jgi:pimeloyl-ACP methyl ester carboxylesterase
MKKIYCISGLGCDEKVFARVKLEGYQLVHLPWLMPKVNEPIHVYARRMSENVTEQNPILLGLSFGGMMSIEIAKLLPAQKVIIISSVKSYKEMPFWMRAAGKIKLNKIIPMRSYRVMEPLQNYTMGISSKEDKEIVNRYRQHVSQPLLTWSVNTILNWQNDWQPPNIVHIHGDSDKIFPIKNICQMLSIKDGGHFMIFNKAKQVALVLGEVLNTPDYSFN